MAAAKAQIVASLWDLRAQLEQQLRRLSRAQQRADALRAEGVTVEERAVLRAELQALLEVNTTVREVATECLRAVEDVA